VHINRAERIWLWFGGIMLAVFLATITTVAIVEGMVPPSHIQSIDPTKVAETPPFDHPGLRKLPDGTYEAYYVAHIFAFDPQQLVIPRGAHVTFYVTSPDVMHGFSIPLTGVNTMVTPGWVSTVSHTFDTAGTFLLVCNEYCGSAHHLMAGKIEVR
jgi:cytochrome c oxidase subunit 2